MRTWARELLTLIGWISILAGIAVFVVAVAVVRPKVVDLNRQIEATLRSVDQATALLRANTGALDAPIAVAQSAGRAAKLVPETLTTLKGTLTEASNALIATKQASRQAEKGLPGLVLPKQQIRTTNTHLDGAADQLKLLAGMVAQLIPPSQDLARNTDMMTRELARAQASLGPTSNLLTTSHLLISDMRRTLAFAGLPTLVVLVGLGIGGLYFLLGCAIVSLAVVLRGIPAGARDQAGNTADDQAA